MKVNVEVMQPQRLITKTTKTKLDFTKIPTTILKFDYSL